LGPRLVRSSLLASRWRGAVLRRELLCRIGTCPRVERFRRKQFSRTHVLLPGRPLLPDHGVEVVQCGCPAQVREVGLEPSQPISDKARVGLRVGVEPADAAEEVGARPYRVYAAAYCAWAAVADTGIS
jgi:hypothetical protein